MRTHIVSVHPFRRVARKQERNIQSWLDDGRPIRLGMPYEWDLIPDWANGAKVQKAGRFSHIVEVTEERGH